MIEWSEVTDERLMQDVRDGLELDQIGARYGVVEHVVLARLRRVNGAGYRPPRRGDALHRLTDEEFRVHIIALGAAELGRRLGVHRHTVQRRQNQLGIVLPPGRRTRTGRFIGGKGD